MPGSPLTAAALVALCFALPFGAAALFDGGPDRAPVAVQTPPIERIEDDPAQDIPTTTLGRAPRLPTLREDPAPDLPAAAPAATVTTAAPAAIPAPAPAPSGGGGSTGSDGSGGSGTSDRFDSTR